MRLWEFFAGADLKYTAFFNLAWRPLARRTLRGNLRWTLFLYEIRDSWIHCMVLLQAPSFNRRLQYLSKYRLNFLLLILSRIVVYQILLVFIARCRSFYPLYFLLLVPLPKICGPNKCLEAVILTSQPYSGLASYFPRADFLPNSENIGSSLRLYVFCTNQSALPHSITIPDWVLTAS